MNSRIVLKNTKTVHNSFFKTYQMLESWLSQTAGLTHTIELLKLSEEVHFEVDFELQLMAPQHTLGLTECLYRILYIYLPKVEISLQKQIWRAFTNYTKKI